MRYPIPAPATDEMLQIKLNFKALFLLPIAKGINKTSGGIGKKEASQKEIVPNAFGPEGLWAHYKTQSYIFLINFIGLFIIKNTYSRHYFSLRCKTCWTIQEPAVCHHCT